MAFVSRFCVLNVIGLALLATAYAQGWVATAWQADKTPLSAVIVCVFVFGLGCVLRQRWDTVEWIASRLVLLGFMGTVVGFIIALGGVEPELAGDVKNITPMVARLIDGLNTALYTTLLGSIGFLWLSLNSRLLK